MKSIILIFILISIISCKRLHFLKSQSNDITLDEKETQKTINLSLNDKIKVFIPSNPTTGFDWEINNKDNISSDLIKITKGHQVEKDDHLVGQPGFTYFEIESANQAGTVTLNLVYIKNWEHEKPLKEVELVINIH